MRVTELERFSSAARRSAAARAAADERDDADFDDAVFLAVLFAEVVDFLAVPLPDEADFLVDVPFFAVDEREDEDVLLPDVVFFFPPDCDAIRSSCVPQYVG